MVDAQALKRTRESVGQMSHQEQKPGQVRAGDPPVLQQSNSIDLSDVLSASSFNANTNFEVGNVENQVSQHGQTSNQHPVVRPSSFRHFEVVPLRM